MRIARIALLFVVLTVGSRLLEAAPPESLTFSTSTDNLGLPVSYANTGVLVIELPKGQVLCVAPRFVESISGTWSSPKIVTNFEPDEGPKIQRSATFEWVEEGATAEVTLTAEVEGHQILFGLAWGLNGMATGHVRADLLIPAEIARSLVIVADKGKVIFEKEQVQNAFGNLPATFTDITEQSTLFTVEGEDLNISVRVDEQFDEHGIEVRLSPYPIDGVTMVSLFDSMKFSIKLPN